MGQAFGLVEFQKFGISEAIGTLDCLHDLNICAFGGQKWQPIKEVILKPAKKLFVGYECQNQHIRQQ